MTSPTSTASWNPLLVHRTELENANISAWFDADPQRAAKFSVGAVGIYLDYSKQPVTDKTMALLIDLAQEMDVTGWRERMFAGEKINSTEQRAVLHTALRNRGNRPISVDGVNVMPDISRVLQQMRGFSDTIRDGTWRGHTNELITDIVNIGIGGSDLGPAMACGALKAFGHPSAAQLISFPTWTALI